MRILVFYVEQDEDVRTSLEHFLKKRYETVAIECEDEAIRLYRKNHSTIDIVIVEFMMNHGIRLIKEIEAINPEQKIITLSGSTVCSCEKGCGFCEENLNRKRIMKPIVIKELREAIESFETAACQLRGECETPERSRYEFLF